MDILISTGWSNFTRENRTTESLLESLNYFLFEDDVTFRNDILDMLCSAIDIHQL